MENKLHQYMFYIITHKADQMLRNFQNIFCDCFSLCKSYKKIIILHKTWFRYIILSIKDMVLSYIIDCLNQ